VAGNGPDVHCSPCHRKPFHSRKEGKSRVSMTWRAIFARPCCWVQYDVPLYDELYASVISFGACACVAGVFGWGLADIAHHHVKGRRIISAVRISQPLSRLGGKAPVCSALLEQSVAFLSLMWRAISTRHCRRVSGAERNHRRRRTRCARHVPEHLPVHSHRDNEPDAALGGGRAWAFNRPPFGPT